MFRAAALALAAASLAACGSSASTHIVPSVVLGREGASSGAMSHPEDTTGGALPMTVAPSTSAGVSDGASTVLPIHYGETVHGELHRSPGADPQHTAAVDYMFAGAAGDVLTAEMHGGEILGQPGSHMDSFLTLLQDGREITHDDDSAGNLDSRLTATLPASGVFVLRASSYGGRTEGTFTLTLRHGAAPAE